jgi:hypothetical protein
MVNTSPRLTTVPLMLFALCMDAADTPCLAAIFPSVSPDLTVYRVDARAEEARDVALDGVTVVATCPRTASGSPPSASVCYVGYVSSCPDTFVEPLIPFARFIVVMLLYFAICRRVSLAAPVPSYFGGTDRFNFVSRTGR